MRAGIGLILVAGAVMVAQRIRSFDELDLGLGPLLVQAAVGLLLLLPPLVGAVGGLLSRAQRLSLSLAGSALRDRRRLVAPAAAVGAAAAFLVAIQAVVGLGLADRERARRQSLTETKAFTAGIDREQVLVGRFSPQPRWEEVLPPAMVVAAEGGEGLDPGLPDDLVERVTAAAPGATVAAVEMLPVRVEGDPVVPRVRGRRAATASPELLEALGIGAFADDLAAGRALALDPSAVRDGRVVLTGFSSLPATVVQDHAVPQHLPAVLVPPGVADDLWTEVLSGIDVEDPRHPSLLVVGRDRPFDLDEVGTVDRAVRGTDDDPGREPLAVVPGDRPVRAAFETGRLDQSHAVVVDSTSDVRLAVIVSLVVALVALGVALRLADLTGRPDDDLLEVLGAPAPPLLRRVVATRALVLALLAVPLGTAVGIVACRMGTAAYNRSSEVGPGELPPIPFTVPVELVAGAVLVPLLATEAAWARARRRAAPDLQAMADRLAW